MNKTRHYLSSFLLALAALFASSGHAQLLLDPYGTTSAPTIPATVPGTLVPSTGTAATSTSTTSPASVIPQYGSIPGALPPVNVPGAVVTRPALSGVVTPPSPNAPVDLRAPAPTGLDYNLTRVDVFGANLFTGAFARQGATRFNPDYVLSIGDQLQVRLWGAFDFDSVLTIDPQGNVFIPRVGPVHVMGVRNQELQRVMETAVARSFKANVNSYASLAAAQPVRIFVGGNVVKPGLYNGTSMDSLLQYLDQAGGIDPDRGSYLAVQVKRGATVRATVNLYDFLLNGTLPLVQLADGDVIFVPPLQQTVRVLGLAQNAKRFEFAGAGRTVADLIALAKPLPAATHVRVVRSTGAMLNTEYYPLEDASRVKLQNGDQLEFTADKKPGTITVRVQGEHQSPQEYVLPYGTRMGELLKNIQYSERSDADSLQLFRQSVKDRQKQMLATSLKALEAAALTARSGTSDEARLRKDESDLLLQWVERAKNVEPAGQVVIANRHVRDELLLENGDVINVPTRDGLVLVSGEVLFPNAVAFDAGLKLDDYVAQSGGYTQNADAARVVLAHRDGTYGEVAESRGFFTTGGGDPRIRPGDQVLVLPKIDTKTRQIWKDLSQIVFQIAVIAKVAVGL